MADKPQQPNEILIDGRLYDATGFKHPGGSIVKFHMGGGDATEAFVEFHTRSKKVQKMLAALPNRSAPAEHIVDPKEAARLAKLSANYKEWRRTLVKEGWFKPSPLHSLYRVLELVVLFGIGIYGMLHFTSLWALIPCFMSAGIATGRSGWLMHEAGHYSMTTSIAIDVRLQEFIYGLGCGMSGGWWRIQHNKHHAAPQKLKHDVDLDTLPLVAFNKIIADWGKKNAFSRIWLPLQGYLFGPVTCVLVTLFWQLFLHPRYMVRCQKYFEMFSVALRWAAAFAIMVYSGCSPLQGFLSYIAVHFFGGAYIFLNFALSHTHLPVLREHEHVHWTEYGADHTIDITPHLFTDWWMGYLNYQIEHHLFPGMPQYRFAKLYPQTMKFFKDNNLKYDVRDYFAAMGDTIRNLHEVGATMAEKPNKNE